MENKAIDLEVEEVTAKGDDIILPEGFHWDNEIPVVVRKFPMDNTSPICFTSIPTRRFINNHVSYGHLLYKFSDDYLGCTICGDKEIKTERGRFYNGKSHIATHHPFNACFKDLPVNFVQKQVDLFSRAKRGEPMEIVNTKKKTK